jgi:CheY-like chemotaxis protein
MVLGFAVQLGGTLKLDSTVGVGTVASLWLPVANAIHEDSVATSDSTADPTVPPLRILVVDDDPLVLSSTHLLLEDLGHQVLNASSGGQALALLGSRSDIDLVISDHAMPSMTGAELAQSIHTTVPGLPVIIASGFAQLSGRIPEGLIRLAKPFNQTDLTLAIRSAIAQNESR